MDTKWKNRKKAISFIIFFLGVSLTLGSIVEIAKNKPGGARIRQLSKMLEDDYQHSGRFRGYIANRLENFLAMASGGIPVNMWEYDYGIYYSEDYYGDSGYYEDYGYLLEEKESQLNELEAVLENLKEMQDVYSNMLEEAEETGQLSEEIEAYREQMESYQRELEDYQSRVERAIDDSEEYQGGRTESLTTEQKKKIAEHYHNLIKGDKNLLYSISYDGKILYSNSDLLMADSGGIVSDGNDSENGLMSGLDIPLGNMPSEYNFLLYFDGETVRIFKDGKELDVYGDGYYRDGTGWYDGSDWYVPGYRNFPVDEKMKKAVVCIAAAREPVLYTEGVYGNVSSRQLDNSLYWMNYYFQSRRELLLGDAVCLAIGIVLLLLSFLSRKSRRQAVEGIARFQAGIWVECKAVLLIGLLYTVAVVVIKSNYGYGIWQELAMAYTYEYDAAAVSSLSFEAIKNISSLIWIILFWMIYFVWTDLRHNKKVWKYGLFAKLHKTFSAKALSQSLARKTACRSTVIFAAAVLYGLVMTGMIILGINGHRDVWRAGILAVLGAVCFLVTAYLTGKKNMETAKDIEALAFHVSEIRNGNYADIGGQFSGHDLEEIMAQLEDIRHGMEKAVDEQMKSERMKVELIANVSHDIKTPLTSIISYVQFLKQEEGLPDHVKDYIKILDEKSQRLKNMVQDVFTVSKAASGELPMHMEELDFGKLLRQTMADMEEQIESSAVAFRTDIPENPVMIMADGQRMYRVFQNLFQNAIKYSLDGSRVYVTLKTDGALAVASVKNTSHMELDKNKDFAERFARGDQSRTDGGSGLGLSIAQSFTKSCGGEFSWETDADLFVVKVAFKTI